MKALSYGKLFWRVCVILSLAMLMTGNKAYAKQNHQVRSHSNSKKDGYFYVGLDYSPALSRIKDFSIKRSNAGSMGLYPYIKDGKGISFRSDKFDWNAPVYTLGFHDSKVIAMEGALGYGKGKTRIEVEIGYENFKVKGRGNSTGKEDDGDAVYLLANELACSLMYKQTNKLAAALARVNGKDIVNFAKELKASYPEIDEKICRKKVSKYMSIGLKVRQIVRGREGNCDAEISSNINGLLRGLPRGSYYGFVASLGKKGAEKWPNINNGDIIYESQTSGRGDSFYKAYQRDASGTVAGDLSALTLEEKAITAGLLAKIIDGGEVIELKAVSSTSVMVNACYDLLDAGLLVVPYACVGLGGTVVGLVDEHVTLKLAYRLKAGLSYQFSPVIHAFVGSFYHQVLGNKEYADLRVHPLADYTNSIARNSGNAVANFSMKYVGGEFGVRLAF
ncbi:surface antigen family protein [Anaplasma phagocytophilum str. CRT53-1]|uniref:Surface antigen family protein n=1 Tax=Anaplasma phagocytophilum str. CRT53-1 TaxID=1359157 RepID=A0A0F3PM28_ANAPH|nr:P44/Msp2 family outer membrane protein [Anaplasma phagocytophilum]KJV80244.1 surface antigen family protein [Anaplasma phagocytophilum str. CRT53-1]